MDLDWTTETVDGVALVGVELENETQTDRRIRLANRLDGPVLPPRRRGVPEAGWDGEGYETVVSAGERVAVGYACPAPADDPPVELVADERTLDGPDCVGDAGDTSAAAVVRRLGAADPPRDAVPTPGSVDVQAHDGVDGPPSERVGDDVAVTLDAPGVPDDASNPTAPDGQRPDTTDEMADTDLPPSVAEWLAAVETRIGHAEALTEPSVAEATEVLAETGGLDAVSDLPETVSADADELRALAERADALAERAEGTDVSLGPLRRLA